MKSKRINRQFKRKNDHWGRKVDIVIKDIRFSLAKQRGES